MSGVLKDTFAHTTQDAIIFVRNGAELVAGEADTRAAPLLSACLAGLKRDGKPGLVCRPGRRFRS